MDKANAVRKGESLDWASLESHLKGCLPQVDGEMTVQQFHGGHANLTYLLRFGQVEYILRRPPFGTIAPGAHDMKREYKVLSRIHQFYQQAPQAFHYNEDDTIIGAPFVIMERRQGVVIRTKVLPCFRGMRDVEERITKAMIKAQADLHLIDYQIAGLSDLGRPDGFLERQVRGWAKRLELSISRPLPKMLDIQKWLEYDVPVSQTHSIIHNDIKPDNCQFQPDNPDVVTSIFDWDMCTLGDPLFDLATTLSYWPLDDREGYEQLPLALIGNFPPKQFLIDEYQRLTGFDLSRLRWYEVFAYWKGAIILLQLHQRYADGATDDPRMKRMGALADHMIDVSTKLMNVT